MLKKKFVEMIKPFLKKNDKPFNRQLWNDTLDSLSKDGELNINKAQHWTKTPIKYYGER